MFIRVGVIISVLLVYCVYCTAQDQGHPDLLDCPYPVVHVDIVQPSETLEVDSAYLAGNRTVFRYIGNAARTNFKINNGWDFSPVPGVPGSGGCTSPISSPILRLGDVSGPWAIKVTNEDGKVKHEDTCLPRISRVPIFCNYTITLTKLQ